MDDKKRYQHILLASDLSKTSHTVAETAVHLSKKDKAKLSLVHAVDMIPAYSYAYMGAAKYEEKFIHDAEKAVRRFAKKYGINEKDFWIEVGNTKAVILDAAQKCKADLIVIGRHGHHGLSMILGSTANAILNHSTIDVLTVHYKQQ
jgi:universal stress protein A